MSSSCVTRKSWHCVLGWRAGTPRKTDPKGDIHIHGPFLSHKGLLSITMGCSLPGGVIPAWGGGREADVQPWLCPPSLATGRKGTFSNLNKGAVWVRGGPPLIQHGRGPTAGVVRATKGTALLCLSFAPKQLPLALQILVPCHALPPLLRHQERGKTNSWLQTTDWCLPEVGGREAGQMGEWSKGRNFQL